MPSFRPGLDTARESQVCLDAVSGRLSNVWASALEEEFTRAFWFARNYSGPPPVETIEAIGAPFQGGEVGEGLDFMGSFKYAVNVGGWPGGMVIGDANFTADEGVPGVEVTAQHRLPNWGDLDLGSSQQDDDLERIMKSVRYSTMPSPVTVTLGGLEPGATYRCQLIFGSPEQRRQDWGHEPLPGQRGFDLYVDGVLVLPGFEPLIAARYNPRTQLTTGAYLKFLFEAQAMVDPAVCAAVTNDPQYTAAACTSAGAGFCVYTPATLTRRQSCTAVTQVEIALRGRAGAFTDNNPSLHGFTLEYIAPASAAGRRNLQGAPDRDPFYITEEEALADTMRIYRERLVAAVDAGSRMYTFEFGDPVLCPVIPPPLRSDGSRCQDTQRQFAGLVADLSQSWDCSGHGVCDGGVCQCQPAYTGAACDECTPGFILSRQDQSIASTCVDDPCEPDICAGHGTCQVSSQAIYCCL